MPGDRPSQRARTAKNADRPSFAARVATHSSKVRRSLIDIGGRGDRRATFIAPLRGKRNTGGAAARTEHGQAQQGLRADGERGLRVCTVQDLQAPEEVQRQRHHAGGAQAHLHLSESSAKARIADLREWAASLFWCGHRPADHQRKDLSMAEGRHIIICLDTSTSWS